MMIDAKTAKKLTNEALAAEEKAAQEKAENWVTTRCPGYVHEAANTGKNRTREFKCPKNVVVRATAMLESLGYTVKYREDCELIRLFW